MKKMLSSIKIKTNWLLPLLLLIIFSCNSKSTILIDKIENGERIIGQIANNVKDGIWKVIYSDSSYSYQTYVSGKLEGPFFVFNSEGEISVSEMYKNNLLNGQYLSFVPGLILNNCGNYKNGKREGLWYEYFTNYELPDIVGKLDRIVEYRNDTMIKVVKNFCVSPPVPGQENRKCD